ncbi:MAG: flavin reductase family protein, partial [Hyphomicrobiales bacterium]|nr:flavin reductase family protein [Hyphomicrobiales bacterium]MBV8663975.1 flavin reductase family protein [Hyphomicrobiales bacterium]
TRSQNGMPILEEAVASFSCRVSSWTNTKTHAVFFGLVEEVHTRPVASPLIYARQTFHHIEQLRA